MRISSTVCFLAFVCLQSPSAHSQEPTDSMSLKSYVARGLFDRANLKRHGLDGGSRERLSAAESDHKASITCVIESVTGTNRQVASLLVQLGGRIFFQADDVDYIRGEIPIGKALELVRNKDILDVLLGDASTEVPLLDQNEASSTPAARYGPKEFLAVADTASRQPMTNLDAEILGSSPQPSISNGQQQKPQYSGDLHLARVPLPLDELRVVNPYLPTYLMGVPQFLKDHPTFDGRGVTIAVIGGGADADHPMLQSGRLLNGSVVGKTMDFGEASRQNTESSVPAHLDEIATASDGSFTVSGIVYHAPHAGTYRFGFIDPSSDHRAAEGQRYALLWSETVNLVWVDTASDHDFRTQPSITDYGLWQQVTRLPGHDPGVFTSIVVKTYPVEHILKVFLPSTHETQVASVAAGNSFIGSQATGVAPGARLIHLHPFKKAFVETFLFAARDPRVDLITCSFDETDAVDGENVSSEILDRIVARYGKPIVKASGNDGPVLTSVRGTASASRVLTVSTYSSRASEKANNASAFSAQEAEYVNQEGSSGPSGLGAIKPDFVAPSPSSRAYPCDSLHVSRSDYQTVRCYFSGDGQSSMAAPMVAGLIADLISGAKQTGTPYGEAQIRYALAATAHHLRDWPIDRQGGGLPQLPEAWKTLFSKAKPAIEVASAAGISADSAYNKVPGFGVGIYEVKGWTPGKSGVRELVLYRSTGPSEDQVMKMDVIGDSSFELPAEVSLPLRSPVSVPVHVSVGQNGLHGAILRLSEKTSGRYVQQIGLYVVCSESMTGANSYTSTMTGRMSRNRPGRVFIEVPKLTRELEVQISSASKTELSVWSNGSEIKATKVEDERYSATAPHAGLLELLVSVPESVAVDSLSEVDFQITVRAHVSKP